MELLEDGRAREGHARRGCECYVGRRHCYVGRHRCDGAVASAARLRQGGPCLVLLPAGVSLLRTSLHRSKLLAVRLHSAFDAIYCDGSAAKSVTMPALFFGLGPEANRPRTGLTVNWGAGCFPGI